MYGHGATVRGQLAYISPSGKCCICVIIHNIGLSVNLCKLNVLILYLNSVYGCCTHSLQSE